MTKEELEKEARQKALEWNHKKINGKYNRPPIANWSCYEKGYLAGAEPREKRIAELEAQIEKLIDFVLSKTECCDVCPITDTCINSEGTCPYAGILAKGEEEVTREWIMQFISKEIKEK